MNGDEQDQRRDGREELRAAAVALRRQGRSRRQIAAELGIRDNRLLTELLRGEPPPARAARGASGADPAPGGGVSVYLRWLDLLGVAPAARRYCLSIHETADVERAVRFWSDLVGVAPGEFAKPVIKRHQPRTTRKNVGDSYRGCLMISVLKGQTSTGASKAGGSVSSQAQRNGGLRRSSILRSRVV